MLKQLFTSNARVKLLTLFLLNPEKEYFVRELTRLLNEQINSVRRELDNLKKIGLLRTRTKSRRKFYTVNTNFLIYEELRAIMLKAAGMNARLIKNVAKMGAIDVLILTGSFLQKEAPVDLLIVGEVDKEKLETYLDKVESEDPIRFSVLSTEGFKYRLECHDQFILNLTSDPGNIIGINKLKIPLA